MNYLLDNYYSILFFVLKFLKCFLIWYVSHNTNSDAEFLKCL